MARTAVINQIDGRVCKVRQPEIVFCAKGKDCFLVHVAGLGVVEVDEESYRRADALMDDEEPTEYELAVLDGMHKIAQQVERMYVEMFREEEEREYPDVMF